MQGAWKVGLLVVLFAAMLMGAYAVLQRSLFASPTHAYIAEFADAGGVSVGTRVLLAGVRVGQVSSVELASPRLARVGLKIDEGVRIPVGSTVQLPSSLIGLGENPLLIIPGPDGGEMLPPGSTLTGGRASAMDNFFPEARETVKELNLTLASVRKLLDDENLKGGLEKLMATSDETIAEFGNLAKKFGGVAGKVDGLIAQNQGLLRQALVDARMAVGDIRKSTALVAEMLADDKWKDQAVLLLENLNSTSLKAEKLLVSLDEFVNDPELREPLAKTMANTEKITDSGTRIAANTEKMAENGVTITEKAIDLADKANEIADEAKKALEKFTGVLGKSPSTGMFGQLQANMDLIRETRPNRYRIDLSASMPYRDTRIHLGLFDAFETNKITAQLGKEFAPGASYRYGIYASKPGIGVDYQLAPRLFLRGDLFDINNPRGDIRARIDFGSGFYGWVGVNQIFKRNAPMIGIGIQR